MLLVLATMFIALPPATPPPAAAAAPPNRNAPRIEADSATELAGVTVTGRAADRLLSVTVGGDVRQNSVVSSAPLGMNCGGVTFQFLRGPYRQCWLRIRRGQEAVLTAGDDGAYGRDWIVEWVGCEARAGGPACITRMDEDRQVAAVFRRAGGR